jgi:peptide/nickel transport system substrate-binding protein
MDAHDNAGGRRGLDRRQLLLGSMAIGIGGLVPLRARAEGTDKSTLSIAFPVDVPSWDPHALSIPTVQNLYATIFDSPLRYSPDLKLSPRQITEWKWVDDKATRLEITLRDDILFHDGSRLTMEDVKFSLSDRAKADKRLVVGGMFNTVSDIEVISPTRGVMQFSRPTPTAPI